MFFKHIISTLTTLIAPPFCAFCKNFLSTDTVFCGRCFDKIQPVVSTTLPITQKYQAKVFAVSTYKEPVRSLILAKNYHNIIASKQLAHLMWQYTYIKNIEFDYIVPVPLHWTRFAKRGFNQTQEMAHYLSKLSGKPVADILYRNKKTAFQAQLDKKKRLTNVNRAFSFKTIVDRVAYKNKTFLVVDDLLTTGATLKSVCRVLVDLKPKELIAVVGARGC